MEENKEEIKKFVFEALGEVSGLFMSREERGVDIIMPSEEMKRIGDELVKKLSNNPLIEESAS